MNSPRQVGIFAAVFLSGLPWCAAAQAAPDASLVVQWNARLLDVAEAEDHFLTLKGVRAAAMMHLAMHDALNAVAPRYRPFTYDKHAPGAGAVAAASQAAYEIARDQYPGQRAVWDAELRRWLGTGKPGVAKEKGIAAGKAAAAAVLARRAGDGWNHPATYRFQPMAPGVYAEFREHSGTPQGFVFGAGWAMTKPFALRSPAQFRAPPPPAISSDEYTRAYDEVREVGRFESRSRTADQTHLAMWWKDFAEHSHNRLARELATSQHTDLWSTARLFALLNVSIMDGYINVFDNKFFYNHWRPYTAIHRAEQDGNPATRPELDWDNTHRHTYAFPSYPSAHGTACAAAMTVMAETFGNGVDFTMSTPLVNAAGPMSPMIPMKPPTRSFESFSDAALECAMSRLYLGIHFRYDAIEGNRLGTQIGKFITTTFLAPLPASRPTASARWKRAPVAGTALEYRVQGSGDAVVLVHGGVFGSWFEPLMREPALANRFSLLTYHRAGYGGSSRGADNSIASQAAQLGALLRHVHAGPAHVVGHSSGALIALQLALDDPQSVQSLTLLEPALSVAAPPANGITSALELYRRGDKPAAIETFLDAVAGPDSLETLGLVLPDATAEALAASDTFFTQELPAVRAWSFTDRQADRLRIPVLAVMGARSDEVSPLWRQRQDWLLAHLPCVQPFTLPGATHLMLLQNPRVLADRLASFFAEKSGGACRIGGRPFD